MHEMGLALEIIDIATASIPADLKGARVQRVNLTVGKLSAVVPDSLRFCFQVASRETPLEGASLNIEEVPVVARCLQCGNEWTIEEPVFRCPACDSPRIQVVSGRELDIRSIELEEKEGD
ncbi:MAG: hydrogenase maturation nickel metallochaperone HypA [Desulfobacterales bacterium]|jgi:hydrogenase nickel incorporation protein HypA/HybF|nr:hydrogenase maturation nickel metallochaperone HypA [Desulfobacteraceae bacterium]MDD3991301.1 hydrogenase maturation nickel metallochaperone HypA [Desulfobacteraceae bacterium]MDY0311586.1 hydrogenase maturation nickel metallochaperone HypA [Desulfobacterales bacterium]